MKPEIIHYVQRSIQTLDQRLTVFTHHPNGTQYPYRFMFTKLNGYITDFLNKKSMPNMVVMPGFRGVGKTTLMAQLCAEYKNKAARVLFLSVEDAMNLFNAGISELMLAYEEILGHPLESGQEPILIFLDEVQSDPRWATSLKGLYEKTRHIFFCCTGSSAVSLQTTPDLIRRAIFEKMPPMCFTEYEMVKNNRHPIDGLKEKIQHALYGSDRAETVHSNLLKLRPEVNQYWSTINRAEIKQYLSYGTLPFALILPNETSIYDAISGLLDKIITTDLVAIGNFDTTTLGVVKRLLFAISENDLTSVTTLAEKFNLNRLTIVSIFDALEKAELLIKIPAYGSNMSIAKKATKYLFMSPAIRMTFFSFTGQEGTYLSRQGKLLEDSIGAHLYEEFILKGQGAIRYDSAEGGADFILQLLNQKQIIIEVGMGNKNQRQIINSQKKINSDYNLIFSNSELSLNQTQKIVSVPLDYYFLM
jgi:predicted AAA+ superfamily ATPase